jgi:hypothetical protein
MGWQWQVPFCWPSVTASVAQRGIDGIPNSNHLLSLIKFTKKNIEIYYPIGITSEHIFHNNGSNDAFHPL